MIYKQAPGEYKVSSTKVEISVSENEKNLIFGKRPLKICVVVLLLLLPLELQFITNPG